MSTNGHSESYSFIADALGSFLRVVHVRIKQKPINNSRPAGAFMAMAAETGWLRRLVFAILTSKEASRKLRCVASPRSRWPRRFFSKARVWLHHPAIEMPSGVPEYWQYHCKANEA